MVACARTLPVSVYVDRSTQAETDACAQVLAISKQIVEAQGAAVARAEAEHRMLCQKIMEAETERQQSTRQSADHLATLRADLHALDHKQRTLQELLCSSLRSEAISVQRRPSLLQISLHKSSRMLHLLSEACQGPMIFVAPLFLSRWRESQGNGGHMARAKRAIDKRKGTEGKGRPRAVG